MTFKTRNATPKDFPALVAIWERAVKATHSFLPETDFLAIREALPRDYLPSVHLRCAYTEEGHIAGFIGTDEEKVEMLFIDPDYFGCGAGHLLLRQAVEKNGARFVDVNEQNPQALGFYHRQGFKEVGRSPLDSQGRPFPILHLELKRPAQDKV